MNAQVSLSLPAPAADLRRDLLAWYDRHRRDLPWRPPLGRRANPYHVLVSEVMLQQTTVATVRPRFEAFLRRFPTLEALARAPLDDVLHEWQGLGYYRRARGLHATAVAVHAGGGLPRRARDLERLPGIGPYTAAAIAAIAFGEPELPVDGNVARVLSRLGCVDQPLPAAMPALRRFAGDLAGGGRPGELAQGVIELGALVCRPRSPACPACPWQPVCRARHAGAEGRLPRKAPKRARPVRYAVAFLIERDDDSLLFRRRPDDALLGGLIELPTTPWQDSPFSAEAAIVAHAPDARGLAPVPGEVRHAFSHLDLKLGLWRGRGARPGDGFFWPRTRLGELALPTLTRKLLRLAEGENPQATG